MFGGDEAGGDRALIAALVLLFAEATGDSVNCAG